MTTTSINQVLFSLTWLAETFVPNLKTVGELAFEQLGDCDFDALLREEEQMRTPTGQPPGPS